MSTDNSEPLSFVCPQCDKKLKAPQKLAGQKLNCPKCGAPIRVPGAIASKNDDDDWLSLDPEPTPQPAVANIPRGPVPNASSAAKTAPIASRKTAPEATPPATTTQSDSNIDEYSLASAHPVVSDNAATSNSRPASQSTPSAAKRSVFDDDLPDLLPLEPPALTPIAPVPTKPAASAKPAANPTSSRPIASKPDSVKPSATKESKTRQPTTSTTKPMKPLSNSADMDDIPLAPLVQPTSTAASLPNPMLVGSLEEIMLESKALEVAGVKPKDEEFAFPCKVCGTRLHTSISKVGSRTRCPDCFTEFSVPSPPPRKQQQQIKLDNTANVTFAPIDAKSLTSPESTKTQSDKILEKAKDELRKERDELASITTPFNSQRWLTLVFWFCRDPMIIILMIILGCVCAAWLATVTLIPEVLQIGGVVAGLIQSFAFFGPGTMLMGCILILGMSILSTVANQLNKIQEWPFGKIGESLGELMVLFAALVLASIPGGIAGTALSTMLDSHLGTILGTLSSIWLLLPFFLLSMADTNSMMEPFSRSVFDSIKAKPDAWGAMYFQTMAAVFGLFVTMGVSLYPGVVGEVLCGLSLPFLIFFIFNQYGLLAGRISGVTDLGFTGDFSADEAA